jgi:hypothetical protein
MTQCQTTIGPPSWTLSDPLRDAVNPGLKFEVDSNDPRATAEKAAEALTAYIDECYVGPIEIFKRLRTVPGDLAELARNTSPSVASHAFAALPESQRETLYRQVFEDRGNDDGSSQNDLASVLSGDQLLEAYDRVDSYGKDKLINLVNERGNPDARRDLAIALGARGAAAGDTELLQNVNEVLVSLGKISNDTEGQFDAAIRSLNNLGALSAIADATVQSRINAIGPVGRFPPYVSYDAKSAASLQNAVMQHGSKESQAMLLSYLDEKLRSIPAKANITPPFADLHTERVPAYPATEADKAALKTELATQSATLATIRDPSARQALAEVYKAQTMAKLCKDAYHWDFPTRQLDRLNPQTGELEPGERLVGWTRASELSDSDLREYGITREMLAPKESGFRAELYVPDPAIFGPDAKPVLSFQGTNFAKAEDALNNANQATSGNADYYERAMALGLAIDEAVDGNFEVAGHSLSGGMASAVSMLTGAKAYTFNAAGLHEQTVQNFIETKMNGNGQGAPYDTDSLITAAYVEGEILSTLQRSANALPPEMREDVANILSIAGNGAWLLQNVVRNEDGNPASLSSLSSVTADDLKNVPEALGTRIQLRAFEAPGVLSTTPSAAFAGDDAGAIKLYKQIDAARDATIAFGSRPDTLNFASTLVFVVNSSVTIKDTFNEHFDEFVEAKDRHSMESIQWGLQDLADQIIANDRNQ